MKRISITIRPDQLERLDKLTESGIHKDRSRSWLIQNAIDLAYGVEEADPPTPEDSDNNT